MLSGAVEFFRDWITIFFRLNIAPFSHFFDEKSFIYAIIKTKLKKEVKK